MLDDAHYLLFFQNFFDHVLGYLLVSVLYDFFADVQPDDLPQHFEQLLDVLDLARIRLDQVLFELLELILLLLRLLLVQVLVFLNHSWFRFEFQLQRGWVVYVFLEILAYRLHRLDVLLVLEVVQLQMHDGLSH